MNKVKQIDPQLKKQSYLEESPAIREILDTLHLNALIRLTKTREDHRFHQGYLQALDELKTLTNKPQ